MTARTPKVIIHADIRGEIQNLSVPLVLLHGFTGNRHVWDALRRKLSHPTIAVDLPGHGHSRFDDGNAEYNFQDWCDDFEFLLDSLNLRDIHLLGYSMGGRLALIYALRFPHRIKSLVLESTHPGLRSLSERVERRRADERLSRFIIRDFTGFLRMWESLPLFSGHVKHQPDEYKKLREIRKTSEPDQLAASLRAFSTGRQPDLRRRLKELSVPVLVITGEEDRKYSLLGAEIKKAVSNCRWISVKKSGHTPHLEQQVLFAGHVENRLVTRNKNE